MQFGVEFSSRMHLPMRRHKRCRFNTQVRKIHWGRKWHPSPEFLPRKFHGQRSLAGNTSWGPQKVRNDWATINVHTSMKRALTNQILALECRELEGGPWGASVLDSTHFNTYPGFFNKSWHKPLTDQNKFTTPSPPPLSLFYNIKSGTQERKK